jgi:hypothetical protein
MNLADRRIRQSPKPRLVDSRDGVLLVSVIASRARYVRRGNCLGTQSLLYPAETVRVLNTTPLCCTAIGFSLRIE